MVKMGLYSDFSRRDWLLICVLGSVNLACSLCASLQAPFYPQEAEKKGATSTEYGLVFGIYELVAFVSCPIFGKYLQNMGVKLMLNGSIITMGVSTLLFGTLTLVNSHEWFIGLSFLIRIIESLGASAAVTTVFSITASVFKDSISTTFATLEIFYGLGFICGPTVGGYLFQLGGFMFPFTLVGVLLLLDGLLVFFIMPKIENGNQVDRTPVKIFSMLKLPPVILNVLVVIASTISVGFNVAILEPHLRQFHLTPLQVGSMFIIVAATYMLTAPLAGRLCDTRADPRIMTIVGTLLVVVSFSLIGPAPYMPFETKLWVICVGLMIHGLACTCQIIPTFLDTIQSASAAGLSDDISMYGIASGVMTSGVYLGGFIGPSVAGYLNDAVGYKQASLFVIAVNGVLFLCMTLYVCTHPRSQQQQQPDPDSAHPSGENENMRLADEKTPLIPRDHLTESETYY